MTRVTINTQALDFDDEGYLVDLTQWAPGVAEYLATEEGLELTEEHWEILQLLREFYHRYQHAPAMRPLVKLVRQELGAEKGRSIHLLKLFPGSPAKVAARLAGLPKPDNCL